MAAEIHMTPFTFRLPKPGTVDPFFGGARTFWNQLILPTKANNHKPPIRSVVIQQPGATRGVRFILFESARQYFNRLADQQCPEAMEAKSGETQ